MKNGEDIVLKINVDKQLKDLHRRKYLKIRFDGMKKKGRIVELENEELGIFDVALLAECGQLLDLDSNLKHDITIEASSLVNLQVVHNFPEYSQLHDAILAHIEELESIEANEKGDEFEEDWDEEREFDQSDELD